MKFARVMSYTHDVGLVILMSVIIYGIAVDIATKGMFTDIMRVVQ